ncbi:hypothetical protein [Streptomyces malaysiensis]|uniref:Uncharacterized protein n=1 Tax=Streptomyces malaysiensis subsp. samsunensis TaxID=459658 RepID=A0A9X2RXG9_STRMQ|nr:hypothetical protein [Streptomyces samsunensis]MCQ8831824.1 hypothetical protein [Streptomyces samsunensis]
MNRNPITPATDPRIVQLAEAYHGSIQPKSAAPQPWRDLTGREQNRLLADAAMWLRAAVESGITPMAERPTPDHSAVWVDDAGDLYGEYQASPPSPLAAPADTDLREPVDEARRERYAAALRQADVGVELYEEGYWRFGAAAMAVADTELARERAWRKEMQAAARGQEHRADNYEAELRRLADEAQQTGEGG